MLDMEEPNYRLGSEFRFYSCKEDDILPEKLLLIKLARLGELECQ